MLTDIARTRPIRSPSQPKSTPPDAAPTRNTAVITPNQASRSAPVLPAGKRSASAREPTRGKSPISNPSNSQPSTAATRAA